MRPENAIEVRDVRKNFKIYLDKGHMLRERVIHWNRNRYERREVLKGISFDVKKGESVGLIGRNGCGKSTTLKLLTRILRPNGGTIEIAGRVCSLIELGAGFHPDMSGRENIYINASIFGIRAKEVDRRIEDIIRFSELEEFIDNPVRTYSSGMYMRLAFSVAINMDADVLLIDEILAVGDNSFQTKCFNKLKRLKEQGTTIVIVSHALGQIEKLCDRAIWIDEGVIRQEGPARQICKEYLEKMETSRLERAELEYRMQLEDEKRKKEAEKRRKEEADKQRQADEKQRRLDEKKKRIEARQRELEEQKRQEEEAREREKNRRLEEELQRKREEEKKRNLSCREVAGQCSPEARREGKGKVVFENVQLLDANGRKQTEFCTGDTVTIKMKYRSMETGLPADFIIGITNEEWIFCYGSSLALRTGHFVRTEENGEVCITIEHLNLLDGFYYLEVCIQDTGYGVQDKLYQLIRFKVDSSKNKDVGMLALSGKWETKENLLDLQYEK